MNEILDSLKAKQAERDGFILELENIAALKALGITRHDIVKSRPVTFYEKGKNVPTGEADIIIGTQLVAKGHNFPLLTLVGVIDADLGLQGSDLRAAERTFQLMRQVAGRAVGFTHLTGRHPRPADARRTGDDFPQPAWLCPGDAVPGLRAPDRL